MCLNPQNTLSWDRNPIDVNAAGYLTPGPSHRKWRNILRISFSIYAIGYRRAQFMRRAIVLQCMKQPANSSFECSNHRVGSMYIVIDRQTVLLYHNSSVWLDLWDVSSRDRNPAGYLTIYLYIYIRLTLILFYPINIPESSAHLYNCTSFFLNKSFLPISLKKHEFNFSPYTVGKKWERLSGHSG